MKLYNFSEWDGDDIWHISLGGCCNKVAPKDEATEAHLLLEKFHGLSCSMTIPEGESDVDRCVEVQLEMKGLRNDNVINDLIGYLIDRYDMTWADIDLYAWHDIDCKGWVFSVANYKYHHSCSGADNIKRTFISYDESKMIAEDIRRFDWEQVSSELLTLRLQLDHGKWGGAKEITYTKKFRGKTK